MNPFETVQDYPSMLNKIAWFNFFIGALIILFLVHRIPEINHALASSFQVEVIDGVSMSLLAVLLALIIALVSRIIKLHNKISNVFHIRLNFDTRHILTPMLLAVQLPVNDQTIRGLRTQRSALMNDLFYEYTSSTKEKCKIDFHHVTIALDQWAWVWIMIEGAFLFILGATVSFVLGDQYPGWAMLLVAVFLIICAHITKETACKKYAKNEIDEILKDPQRKNEVTARLTAFIHAI